jgi:prepilin-type N-terminal cleavage/methylation domain-containing protein
MNIKRFRASRRGFTLVEIMIVVAIIGLLMAIAVPNFIKTRTNAQKQLCIENLAQIEAAKQMWGVEVGKSTGDVPTSADLIGATLYLKQEPRCPKGDLRYDFKAIGTTAACTSDPALHVLD